jgi:type IV secretory pathway VirB2 component (pilin)
MIQKIKNRLIILASLLALATPALVPVAAHAAPYGSDNLQNSLCQGTVLNVNETNGSGTGPCDDAKGGTSGLNGLLQKVVNIISGIVGVIAVIMIIWGGFKYITSGGDSNNVSGAKNTIIYAIIGLVIVALAQLIVHFVISQSTAF